MVLYFFQLLTVVEIEPFFDFRTWGTTNLHEIAWNWNFDRFANLCKDEFISDMDSGTSLISLVNLLRISMMSPNPYLRWTHPYINLRIYQNFNFMRFHAGWWCPRFENRKTALSPQRLGVEKSIAPFSKYHLSSNISDPPTFFENATGEPRGPPLRNQKVAIIM